MSRLPSDPASVSERRWTEASRRPAAGRPRHRRRFPLQISPPLRRPRTPAADFVVEGRAAGRDRRTDSKQRAPHDPPSRIQDLRGAHRRRERIDRGDLDESVVPEGHPSARCPGRALRRGRGARRTADHQPRLRGHRRRRATAADPDEAQTIHTGRIVPVYEKAGAMTPKLQRRLVFDVLSRMPADLPDPFPEEVRRRLHLPDRRAALMAAHFPPLDTPADQLNAFRTPAQVRLIFEEFFLFQLGLMLRKRAAVRESKPRTIEVERSHPRIGAPHSAVQADRRAAERAERDRRRHAALDADEPAAAG